MGSNPILSAIYSFGCFGQASAWPLLCEDEEMTPKKLLTRQEFGEQVFARDDHKCVICGKKAVDAHHILDRKLFADGGYYLENGSSLCSECHLEAEKTTISVEEIRTACGIETAVLPEGFSQDASYDKWGNKFAPDGVRDPGPLFHDDGFKKILTRAGLLYSGAFRFT